MTEREASVWVLSIVMIYSCNWRAGGGYQRSTSFKSQGEPSFSTENFSTQLDQSQMFSFARGCKTLNLSLRREMSKSVPRARQDCPKGPKKSPAGSEPRSCWLSFLFPTVASQMLLRRLQTGREVHSLPLWFIYQKRVFSGRLPLHIEVLFLAIIMIKNGRQTM